MVFIFVIMLLVLPGVYICLILGFVFNSTYFTTRIKDNHNILLYFEVDSSLFRLNISSDCTNISVFLLAVTVFSVLY